GVFYACAWNETGLNLQELDDNGNPIIKGGSVYGLPMAAASDGVKFYVAAVSYPDKVVITSYRQQDLTVAPYPTPDGFIDVYAKDQVTPLIPKGIPIEDFWIYAWDTLPALVTQGNDLFVADVVGNRILQYDKNTGAQKNTFAVPYPTDLALSAD